ncbi:hypothetical protein 2 [Wuhan arthropod virus 3]|uniref:hypothetical protein 2 n=1 Tax=Wuhan arthropod virus 3 TaxID=1923692 RepID=UPI000909F2A8|nr:hypothetical protein 2 [Wuhan arthropod virus 3]APG78405.1 hypothetical protein 2 [Wuhan arthropod virus 3]
MSTQTASAVSMGDEVFSSTEDAPLPVSAIQAEHADPGEAVPHVGAANTIDPFFYEQFVAQTNFTWTSSDNPGKLLYTIPIHPVFANIYLAYLVQLYNTWVGGLDFKVKVAGTGFHAGALILARIPPNIDPNSLTTTSAITAFPCTFIDPKTLTAASQSIMDQRQLMYHYTNYDSADSTTIGGHFAIYVLQSLNTSASGTNQIDVQVFCKASADFELLQIKPPNLTLNPPTPTYANFTKLFDRLAGQTTPYAFGSNCIEFIVAPTTGPIYAGLEGARQLDGSLLGTYTTFDEQVTAQRFSGISGVAGTNAGGKLVIHRNAAAPYTFQVIQFYQNNCKVTGVAMHAIGDESTPASYVSSVDVDFTLPYNASSTAALGYMDESSATFVLTDGINPVVIPTQGESLVGFGFYATRSIAGSIYYTAQSTQMALGLRDKVFGEVPPDSALLFILIDTVLSIPVNYLKLYPQGFFTSSHVDQPIVYDSRRYRLEYVGLIEVTTTVPTKIEFETHKLAMSRSFDHKKKRSGFLSAAYHGESAA